MFKVLLISLLVVYCKAGIDGGILARWEELKLASRQKNGLVKRTGLVESPTFNEAVIAAPEAVAVENPLGLTLRGVQQLAAPGYGGYLGAVHAVRTQQVLPIQDLGVRAGPEVLQLKSDQDPVLIHFQTQSAPVHVETSHIPAPPGETVFSQTEEEPHRVVHEVIRPVIQEVREIIQPYRKITQSILPVQEEVHTDIATNSGRGAVIAAAAPAVVAAPALVAAQTPAIVGGVVAAPASLYTRGSYIQAFLDQYRARTAQAPVFVSQPKAIAVESAPLVDTLEPIAAEAKAPVIQEVVAPNRGAVKFTQYNSRHH